MGQGFVCCIMLWKMWPEKAMFVSLTYKFTPYEGLATGSLALNAYQRRNVKVSVGDTNSVERCIAELT